MSEDEVLFFNGASFAWDNEAAATGHACAKRICTDLSDLAHAVHDSSLTDAQKMAVRRMIGTVMTCLIAGLVMPVEQQHPSLRAD